MMNREELTIIAEQISWIIGEKMTYSQAVDFAELVANAEREEILGMADSLGYVDIDAILARHKI
jgi:hypothetical protein